MILEESLLAAAPNWVGFSVAIILLYKITTNALHGIAESNQKIAIIQTEMVRSLESLRDSLEKQTNILSRWEWENSKK